jgi:hypothetical protein
VVVLRYWFDKYWEFSGIILKGRRTRNIFLLKENVDFLRSYDGQSNQLTTGHGFVRLLIDDVVPAMNKLRGPITMAEVKLSSAFRYCGNFVVIDGKAVLISLITTKEIGKECLGLEGGYHERSYWACKENAMMKASIQTSIYKLMLMELGIQTGQTAVLCRE